MLGHALHATGQFGFPLEYANPGNIAQWQERLGTKDVPGTLREIQKIRTSSNGVFGIKIHYPHIAQFGGFEHLLEFFPGAYFVLLTRKDVLRQAVSLSIASQTGVWIAGQKPVTDNPRYSFDHIDSCLRETLLNNASWRYTLAASGCKYLEVDFSSVRQNIRGAVENIARFMDLEIEPSSIPKQQVTERQSNRINEEWTNRFVADFNRASELLTEQKKSFTTRAMKKIRRALSLRANR
jgi:LPS sulfotransferase NodH